MQRKTMVGTGNHRLKEIRLGSQTGSTPRTLTWDAKGRLRTVGAETYTYDPMDYRIGRSGGSMGNLDYFLEGEHLESVEIGGALVERYFRGAGTDELVAAWLRDSDGNSTPYLFHHDHLTSVTAVSGHNGGTTQSIRYTAFGQQLSASGSTPNRLKFTGREDDQTGLYYYRARYLDPAIGRFVSEDPLGFQAGINFYAYVGNNPINANDPMGLLEVNFNGPNANARNNLENAYNRFAGTPTGSEIVGEIDKKYDVLNISVDLSPQARSAFEAPSILNKIQSFFGWNVANVTIAPNEGGLPFFSDASGNMILRTHTSQELVNHELPHVAGTLDDGAYGLNTVKIQNKIATEMGIPYQRLTYQATTVEKLQSSGWPSVDAYNSQPNADKMGFYNTLLGPINANYGSNSFSTAGGHFLYPNKANLNSMQRVYSK